MPRLPAWSAVRPLRSGPTRGIVRSRSRQLHSGIEYHQSGIDHVEIDADQVHLARRDGARLRRARRRDGLPSRARGDRRAHRSGLDGEGVHVLRPRGAAALAARSPVRRRAARRQRGRHADQVPGRAARVLFPRRRVLPRARHPRRGRVAYVTPLKARSPKRTASQGARRDARGAEIEVVTEFNTGEVDNAGGRLVGYDTARCPSTWRSSSPSTAAPPLSAGLQVSATTSKSFPPTNTHSNRERGRTCSRSATPRTCRSRKPDR